MYDKMLKNILAKRYFYFPINIFKKVDKNAP